ncbi:MAG TPA: hypothetical protein VER12_19365 [Polyangiaceae bacterium]|nr:hypothetical protein [Polyangiaceae bacterium]
MASSDDIGIVCPFPALPDAVGELTHVRGTLLASSIQSLRSRGLFERYSALLPDSYRDRVLNSVAGEWLDTEIALAHYSGCDALGLPVAEQIGMGRDVSKRTHETFLGLIVKMARGAGVTPWVVFPKINSLYMRIFRGGGIQITRLSPKQARVQTLGLTPLGISYFRNAYLGMYEAGVSMFASNVLVRPLSLAASPPGKDFTLHLQWD